MFEVGWSEYVVIFGLALIVLGPEKLPKLAASIGRWVGRARTMARQFRDQLESEAGSIRQTMHDVQKDFESAASDIQTSVNDVKQDVESGLQEPRPPDAAESAAAPEAGAPPAAASSPEAATPPSAGALPEPAPAQPPAHAGDIETTGERPVVSADAHPGTGSKPVEEYDDGRG